MEEILIQLYQMGGTLYIIATPIGNLEDMTFRALRILKEVDMILVEDTRVTKKLMMHYDIPARNAFSIPASNAGRSTAGWADAGGDKPIMSYHQHSREEVKIQILKRLVEGENIALVSDAGTPGISDPGNELIDFLLEKEPSLKVIPIPGASAAVTALSVSGFKASKFIFLGFLPKKKKNKLFEWLKTSKMTFAFYESPHRLLKTLSGLSEHFGKDRRVFIARELTKLHETLYRGNIQEIIEKIGNDRVKGEVVVIMEG